MEQTKMVMVEPKHQPVMYLAVTKLNRPSQDVTTRSLQKTMVLMLSHLHRRFCEATVILQGCTVKYCKAIFTVAKE